MHLYAVDQTERGKILGLCRMRKPTICNDGTGRRRHLELRSRNIILKKYAARLDGGLMR